MGRAKHFKRRPGGDGKGVQEPRGAGVEPLTVAEEMGRGHNQIQR